MIRIETLGHTRVFAAERELRALPSQPIRCALLIYLAIERTATRDRLLGIFWPEQDDRSARHALNQNLYELRKSLGEGWLHTNGDQLTVEASIEIDVVRFEEAIERSDYRTALEVYGGRFLSAGPVLNIQAFEEWVDQRAFRLRRAWIRAAQHYVGQLDGAGTMTQAIQVAHKVVQDEPQEDQLQHRLIDLLHRAGRRNEALQQYAVYERALAADGLEPLEETKALIEQLRTPNGPGMRRTRPIDTTPPRRSPHSTQDFRDRLNRSLADRYQIEREIGAGGMATVYLAQDIRHKRRVALKVLRPELGASLGPERFLSEINVTANLQHPHLLPLFDSGEADDLLFYVMPFVDGESLRQRLERERQLPVDEAIRIAVAVASALDHAHRHGVVHRDLKPENILLQDGEALVSDFGIALAISQAGGTRVTRAGLAVGTPAYMSPEQAAGQRAVDARSDIYSLGAVLYEMLTGDPPHLGSTAHAVIAKTINERPQPVRLMRDTVPEQIDAAIMCALAKLPADRFLTAGDFADALEGLRPVELPRRSGSFESALPLPVRWRRRVNKALIGAAMISTIALIAALVWPKPNGPAAPALFPILFSDSVQPTHPDGINIALSRDGTQLAFAAAGPAGPGIYVRRMGEFSTRMVRGTQGGISPQFSPDGNWILFTANGQLLKVPTVGGAPVPLANTDGQDSHWGDDRQILYRNGSQLWLVSENGGSPKLVVNARSDSTTNHSRYGWPYLLPGGEAALITIQKRSNAIEAADLGVLRLRDGQVTELGISGTNPRYLPTGHMVFARADGTVFMAPFSLRRLNRTAEPIPVLENVEVKPSGAAVFTVADNGDVAYKTLSDPPYRRLVVVDRKGVATPLDVDSLMIAFPRVDPTGRRIALSITQDTARDIWTFDLLSGALTRVTNDSISQRAEWLPDGNRLAYLNLIPPVGKVQVQAWDRSSAPEVLIDTTVAELSLGPSGTYLAVRFAGPTNGSSGSDIWIAPADSPRALRPFLTSPATEKNPRVSPNGRWLAYVSDESNRDEVYVIALPGRSGRIQVSNAGGSEPVWSQNGRELFYRSQNNSIMSVVIRETPSLDVMAKDSLFFEDYMRSNLRANYDVFPDGQRFVFVESTGGEQRGLWGITRWWPDALERARSSAGR